MGRVSDAGSHPARSGPYRDVDSRRPGDGCPQDRGRCRPERLPKPTGRSGVPRTHRDRPESCGSRGSRERVGAHRQEQAQPRHQPSETGRPGDSPQTHGRTPTSSSGRSAFRSTSGWGRTTRRSAPSIPGWSTPLSAGTALATASPTSPGTSATRRGCPDSRL